MLVFSQEFVLFYSFGRRPIIIHCGVGFEGWSTPDLAGVHHRCLWSSSQLFFKFSVSGSVVSFQAKIPNDVGVTTWAIGNVIESCCFLFGCNRLLHQGGTTIPPVILAALVVTELMETSIGKYDVSVPTIAIAGVCGVFGVWSAVEWCGHSS